MLSLCADHAGVRARLAWCALPVLYSMLSGCGGGRENNDFATLAAREGSNRARALTVTVTAGPPVNRYDFDTGLLTLPGLRVADGARTVCYDANLRTLSTEPFVMEVTAAAEVACTTVGTVQGSYAASGQLTLTGMTAARASGSRCYDVTMNRVNSSPIRLQLASTVDAGCAGVASSTAGVACALSTNTFNSSAKVQANSISSWSCSSALRTLSGNGIPDHPVTDGNFATPISAQNFSVSMPLLPLNTGSQTSGAGNVGYVLNGVKLDPGTAGTCPGTATSTAPNGGCVQVAGQDPWRIEALGGAFAFGTDSSNAHVQPNGQYHYHGMPEGFMARLNKGRALTLVAFAKDGFPIYARFGYSNPADANSPVKVMMGSFAKKATPDPGRPAVAIFPMGTFTQDYQYVAGSGDLEECTGRWGVTPEFPAGIYHYYITETYPYIQRCVKGPL